MYSRETLVLLTIKDDLFYDECNKYGLLDINEMNEDLNNVIVLDWHVDFVILYAVAAYREHKIQESELYAIYDKIEALVYAEDMIGIEAVIKKINKEIVEEVLNESDFNYICVRCFDD